jgi:TldD protein
MSAIGAAKAAGATFSDARIGRYRQNFVGTREKQITQVGDTDSIGLGVRALVNGAWGFAATQALTTDGVVAAAREAAAIAKANRIPGAAPVVLAPSPSHPNATWKSAYKVDPFTIPVEQKAQLLIDANTEAMKVADVKFVNSTLFFVREDRNYANTDGSFIQQTVIRSWVPFSATAVSSDFTDFQSRGNVVQPAGRGWEYILAADLVGNARKWGEEAAEKLKAKPVEVGRYDLVLHPTHLWLTIHESIGHATELDRAMGYEANYAGTSFVKLSDVGKLKYGSKLMNITADKTDNGLGSYAYDDDGVKAQKFPIVRDGILVGLQTNRETAHLLGEKFSRGCTFANSWRDYPFLRMPHVHLEPGPANSPSKEELIADVKDGVLIDGRGSYSIDQQRYNGQFGGHIFWEIKNGKITRQVTDVTYNAITTDFWGNLDGMTGPKEYMKFGTGGDAKGQPTQTNSISHGSPYILIRKMMVGAAFD